MKKAQCFVEIQSKFRVEITNSIQTDANLGVVDFNASKNGQFEDRISLKLDSYESKHQEANISSSKRRRLLGSVHTNMKTHTFSLKVLDAFSPSVHTKTETF